MNIALLLGLLAAYAWYVRGGGVRGGGTTGRIARYRRWLRRAPVAFGVSSVVALAIAGRIEALMRMPLEFSVTVEWARRIAGFADRPDTLKIAVLAGIGGGALIGLALSGWQRRRGRRELMAGNLATILPRSRAEIGVAAVLAITAGVIEELFFRLVLPLTVALVTGSDLAGFGLAAILFMAAHRSFGWAGMAFAAVAGAMLAILYLATGELWFAMLVHAFLNLNGLVLRPAVLGPEPAISS